MNELHEANWKRWEAAAERWAEGADSRGLWRRCPSEPELVLCDRELAHLSNLAGKRVCVLGSGDNQVAFALAGMRSEVGNERSDLWSVFGTACDLVAE